MALQGAPITLQGPPKTMSSVTFAQDVEEKIGAENIEAVVIGNLLPSWNERDEDATPVGKVLSWAEAAPWLDYLFDTGYSGPDRHPVYIYTSSSIWFVKEYDGKTTLECLVTRPLLSPITSDFRSNRNENSHLVIFSYLCFRPGIHSRGLVSCSSMSRSQRTLKR